MIVIFSKDFCEAFMDNLVRPISLNALNKVLNETALCRKIRLCKFPIYISDDEVAYTNRVLKNKPPRKYPETDPKNGNFTFVVFSDAHIDRNYREGAEADCSYPICCRDSPTGFKEVKHKAGKWGSMDGPCDVPFITVHSFIDYAATQVRPDFFLWLGDNNGHDVWNVDKDIHLWPTHNTSNKLAEKYGDLGKVYPVMGNHESLPCDEFDFNSDQDQWILNDLGDYWSRWLTKECKLISNS